MNYQDIIELSNITEGMNITQSSLPQSCQICLENKITKSPKSQEEYPYMLQNLFIAYILIFADQLIQRQERATSMSLISLTNTLA